MKSLMRYSYTAAWAVVGGISLSQDSPPIELASSKDFRFLLTRDPDALLAKVDESSAIGQLMLKGQLGAPDFATGLAEETKKIRFERKQKLGALTVLLFEAQGEIDATLKDMNEYDTFIVALDAVEKPKVQQIHKSNIEAMKMAIAFEGDTPSRFADLADETHLFTEANKIIYTFTLKMSADVLVSTSLSNEATKRISARYALLNKADDLGSVERLFSQMAEYGTDRLKAFLSGWAALEILIAKSFKSYEQAFLAPFTTAEQPALRERFLGRLKDVMKDKYRLTDKFIAVTTVLFPEAADADVQKDCEKFVKLKDLRDSILHGEPFSEEDLPVAELAALLRKYVLRRTGTP